MPSHPSQLCLLGFRSPMADAEFGGMSIKEVEIEGKHKPLQPHWYEVYVQPCIAELLGATLFIFIGCSSVIENVESTGRLQPALAHGLALGLNIAFLGNIRYGGCVALGWRGALLLLGGQTDRLLCLLSHLFSIAPCNSIVLPYFAKNAPLCDSHNPFPS